jgi:hypothetical protein
MEVLEEICRMFFNGVLDKDVNHLPFNIIPRGSDNHFRCCVYKERAILKLRTLAAFGYSVNEIDEALPLTDFLLPEIEKKYKTNKKLLTVLESACSACVKSRFMVSEICQGCLSRKCESSCPSAPLRFQIIKPILIRTNAKTAVNVLNHALTTPY